jgi:hypothetical protein
MEEQWRPVVGYENEYEVSDQGRVRSLTRIFYQPARSGALYPYRKKGRLLKPGLTSVGYPSVALCRKTHLVHRLVAAAFIGPCPAGWEVRHKDGSRTNNAVHNLEYGTRKDNVADARRHKTLYAAHDKHRKIPLEDHDKIRAMYRSGICQKDICAMYGVTVSPIHKILRCGLI